MSRMEMKNQKHENTISGVKNKWNHQKIGGCKTNKHETILTNIIKPKFKKIKN